MSLYFFVIKQKGEIQVILPFIFVKFESLISLIESTCVIKSPFVQHGIINYLLTHML
jgi:hypothetical protein